MASFSFGHKKNLFTSKVIDPNIKFQSDPSGPHTLLPTRLTVKIHYELVRIHAILLEEDTEKSTILEKKIEKREAECDASLVELGSLEKALAFISPELSRIGVRRAKHKGIVKKIVCAARAIEFAIGKCGKDGMKAMMIEEIEVEILRSRCKWLCDACFWGRERKCRIKMLLQSDDHDDRDRDGCSICLEEFGVGRAGVRLPCMHKFHAKCILEWLMNKSSCPLCRFLYAHLDNI